MLLHAGSLVLPAAASTVMECQGTHHPKWNQWAQPYHCKTSIHNRRPCHPCPCHPCPCCPCSCCPCCPCCPCPCSCSCCPCCPYCSFLSWTKRKTSKTSKTSIKSCWGRVAVQATNSTKHHVQCPGTVGIVHAHSLTASIGGDTNVGDKYPQNEAHPARMICKQFNWLANLN